MGKTTTARDRLRYRTDIKGMSDRYRTDIKMLAGMYPLATLLSSCYQIKLTISQRSFFPFFIVAVMFCILKKYILLHLSQLMTVYRCV